MANIKQQKKRVLTNEKRRIRNASFKSSVKTSIKAVEKAVAAKDTKVAESALALAYKKLDKAQAKGIYHSNYVARKKSNLALLVNKI